MSVEQSIEFEEKWLNDPLKAGYVAPDYGDIPLDLINGHLTYEEDDTFTLMSSGVQITTLKNWYKLTTDPYDPMPYCFKTQLLESGGYEVTSGRVDLPALARMVDAPRSTGKRVAREQNIEDIERSINRAKKAMRLKVKSMGCDRLLTLTKREAKGSVYWTKEEWLRAWDKFRRLCAKAGSSLQYVAVLEPHKKDKDSLHLHAAIVGHVHVNTIRKIWLQCCGNGVKGSGNVDISFKPHLTDIQRKSGVAKYLSKYMSKQLGDSQFNKKRYWSSIHKLPDPVRHVFSAPDFFTAIYKFCEISMLDFQAVLKQSFFFNGRGGLGAWFSYDDSLALPVPF